MNIKSLVIVILSMLLHACGGGGGGGTPVAPPPLNRSPVALDQNEGTNPDVVFSGSLLASDADGDPLTYSIVGNPAAGAVILSGAGNRTFTYTPGAGFSGTDSFTFQASDGEDSSNTATVTVNVNFKPVATGGSLATSEAAPISGSVSATDAEGDSFTFAISSQPVKGSITAFDEATGDFTYSPNPIQDGPDNLSIIALDPYQASDPAVVNLEIFNWAQNQQFGTALDDRSTTNGFFQDTGGNLYFGGQTDGQLGTTTPAGLGDGWLRKADRRGNELWTVQFGDAEENNARIITPAPDGSGTIVLQSTEVANIAARVLKYDNDGNEALDAVTDFGPGIVLSSVYQGAVDPNGDVWILSWTDDKNSLITKVSGVNGNTTWQKSLENSDFNAVTPFIANSSDIRIRSVDFDSGGNAIVSGWMTDDAMFTRPCGFCSFLASYDTNGNLLWLEEIIEFSSVCPSSDEGRAYRATVASDDSIWVSGHGGFSASTEFFGQVSKYNSDGTQILWSNCTVGSEETTSNFTPIRFTANGDGLVLSTIQAAVDPVSGLRESSRLNLKRLNSSGIEMFSRSITANKADGSLANMFAGDVFEDAQGLIYISANMDGELTSGANVGGNDVFLMRFDANGNPAP